MISETLLEAEQKFVRSGVIGVGGTCVQAAEATTDELSGRNIENALRQWEAGDAEFPHAAVAAHYQTVGRNGVRPRLVAMLQNFHDNNRAHHVLGAWLPMTFDAQNGDYLSYVGLDYFDQVVRSDDAQRVDAFVAAAAMDLALLEARALGRSAHAPQVVRTRAVTRVVTQLDRLAPDFSLEPSVAAAGLAALAQPGADYGPFASVAAPALNSVPEEIGSAVRLTLLPTTRLHDEQMFIRCIQIFEGLYRQVATAISRSIRDLRDGLAAAAKDRLDRASIRLEAVPALFRFSRRCRLTPSRLFAASRMGGARCSRARFVRSSSLALHLSPVTSSTLGKSMSGRIHCRTSISRCARRIRMHTFSRRRCGAWTVRGLR